MIKIRYNAESRQLSGWTGNEAEFDRLKSRKGERTAKLDIEKPDVDDYEYCYYRAGALVVVEPEPLAFTACPPGMAIGERLNNIEDFLEKRYPG